MKPFDVDTHKRTYIQEGKKEEKELMVLDGFEKNLKTHTHTHTHTLVKR